MNRADCLFGKLRFLRRAPLLTIEQKPRSPFISKYVMMYGFFIVSAITSVNNFHRKTLQRKEGVSDIVSQNKYAVSDWPPISLEMLPTIIVAGIHGFLLSQHPLVSRWRSRGIAPTQPHLKPQSIVCRGLRNPRHMGNLFVEHSAYGVDYEFSALSGEGLIQPKYPSLLKAQINS